MIINDRGPVPGPLFRNVLTGICHPCPISYGAWHEEIHRSGSEINLRMMYGDFFDKVSRFSHGQLFLDRCIVILRSNREVIYVDL